MPGLPVESITDFADFGVRAFTTTREAGSFGLSGAEPVGDVLGRWSRLRQEIAGESDRLVLGRQVHGSRVLEHWGGWNGWLLAGEGDGHIAHERGISLAVTIADCVPIFIAHPSGVVALLHSGWRGTTQRIVNEAIAALGRIGLQPADLRMHLGPAICGRCYEVSADVREQLTGMPANRPGYVDLRLLIAEHAREAGVQRLSVSEFCTKEDARFFSHRGGDDGRQVAVIVG